jgi:hypothetical protein
MLQLTPREGIPFTTLNEGWSPSKGVSVNRPSLRTFFLQTRYHIFFGFSEPSEQHITDRIEARLHNGCRGIFCFAIADRQLDQS